MRHTLNWTAGLAIMAIGTSTLAAPQIYNGDLIQIAVGDGGSLGTSVNTCIGTAPVGNDGTSLGANYCGIHVKKPSASGGSDPYVLQYLSWGTVVHFTEDVTPLKYGTPGNGAGATIISPVSNTLNTPAGGANVVSVSDLGSTGLRLTQTISYLTGTRYVTKRWVLQNTHATTTYTGLKLLHGGDTYFGGEDSAYGFYDAVGNAVYLKNSAFDEWGVMRFAGLPGTPADQYFEGHYGTVWSQMSTGSLGNTVQASFHDAGYALQWNRATLAPGESWTVEAIEGWSDAGSLQVLPPAPQTVAPGQTLDLSYTVQNLDASTVNTSFSASAPAGWTATVQSTTPQDIASNGSVSIVVRVTVPAGASNGDTASIQLTANDGSDDFVGSVLLTVESSATPVNGACGTAQGTASAFAPTGVALCAAGTASAVSLGSDWSWTCDGENGGTNASCSAPFEATATNSGEGYAEISGGTWGVDQANSAGFIATSGDPSGKSPPNLPEGYTFPHGLFDFVLTGGANGSTATIEITYPANIPANAVYWKYGPSPEGFNCTGAACESAHWYRMPANQVAISGNTITLTITDGGVGDDDLAANGTIVDQGGPGIPVPSAIPTLSQWGMILLSGFLALATLLTLRRQRN
ncbi:MAG: IPTL-CTERM sorting domain-containing protein [Pseudomonadota bacterium]